MEQQISIQPQRLERGLAQVAIEDGIHVLEDVHEEYHIRVPHRPGAPDLYPEHLRQEIDSVNKRVFTEVNNGVYRCGFAGSQDSYNSAYARLWTAMDWLEERLTGQRYLVGDTITAQSRLGAVEEPPDSAG